MLIGELCANVPVSVPVHCMIWNAWPEAGTKPLIKLPARLLTFAPRFTDPVTLSLSVAVFNPPISTLNVVPALKVTLPETFSVPALRPGAMTAFAEVRPPTVPVPPRVPPVMFTGLPELLPFTSRVPAR